MPRIKSAKKRLRKSREQRVRNQATQSRVKTMIRTARSAIAAGTPETAAAVRAACSVVDKAASKGALHRNAAARRKSRLMRRAQKATA